MLAGIIPDLDKFDGDEVFLLFGSGVVCLFGLGHWLFGLRPVSKLGSHPLYRAPFYFAVLAGFLFLGFVLQRWVDPQIWETSGYGLLVLLMGGACLTIAIKLLPWLGISLRDDAFERRNLAAVLALSGMALGVLITYSAANIGTGPSFWNNVFSSLLATGALLATWVLMATAGGAAASIVEDRDTASGLRVGLFLVAQGFILGRAIAGNWTSASATTLDFVRDGWPALLLCAAAIFIERLLRPSLSNPRPSVAVSGFTPGLIYLLTACAWCAHLGWWEGGPK